MAFRIFSPDNHEELVSVSRLGLAAVDHLLGYVPSHDALPSAELGALVRLLSATLALGLGADEASNGQSEQSD